uniref:MucBP domain-containing protein n=1 Tax=Peptoniphilus grossensis TaxID=1465756 RepID=UPI00288AE506
MKAISRAGKIFFASIIFIMAIFIGNEKVFAATTVTDFNGLKQAIETGTDDINVQGPINVTETLTIRRDVKISGGGLKASNLATTEPESGNIFYVEEGKNFELENITLDGDKKARIIYSNGGILKITNSTIKNGFPGANAKANPGGGIFLRGGSLTATDTDFIGNTPGTNTALPKGDGDLNGGAIYSGSTKADITITGGKFEDNEVKAYGHGAAIYQENGILNVTGTSFKNNKGHVEGGNAGTQGACIHTRDKVKATISNVEAEIAKGFNTGGFLRSWGSDVTVTNSTFTIKDLGDGYGYSGGALCFENGTSKVTGSTFTCTGSKLYHAGGFIDIVGGGEHKIDNNTMTGAGKENGQQIASFGGAISVEESANATVTITNNTIKNTSASDTGGAIAIGTHEGKSTPSTVTMSGNTISNAGTLFWGGQYGGGVFVAPDATVTMTKDTIKDTRSSYGGGVYNEGKLTISGGSSLTGGVGSKLGGEIYNNGDLIVDDATITGSFVGGAAWQQYASHRKNYELGGTNIYAEKDVTITPKANITTGKDVRVLDGQSKILLTGALNKEIDVSISEIAGGSEKPNRRVGYVIAEGKGGYVATKSDANFLHYIGRTNKEDASHYSNQPRAAFADDKSTGEWDFVLDKDNKKVVLGQRVKLIYHGNLGKLGENDKEEKTVDVYKNPNFWEGQLEEYQVADPELEGSSFMGWYFWKSGDSVEDTDDSIQNIKIPDDLREDLFDFSKVKFVNNEENTDKIITPNIIHTYAGWSENISIPVLKQWKDTKDTDQVDVTVTLKGGDEEKTLTLTKAGNYFNQFEGLKVFTKSYKPNEEKNMNLKFTPRTYSVEEKSIDGFTASYSPQSMIANQVAEVSQFVVTNTKVKTGSVYVKYVDEQGKEISKQTELKKDAPVGEDYTASPKTIEGYETGVWQEGSAPENGKVVEGEQTVVYVYKKVEEEPKTGSVYVKYVDEQGKEISEKTELKKDAPVGEDYTASPKT